MQLGVQLRQRQTKNVDLKMTFSRLYHEARTAIVTAFCHNMLVLFTSPLNIH